MLRILTGALFLLCSGLLAAQSGNALKKNGEKAFAASQWEDALTFLDQYQLEKPGDLEVLTMLGICHVKLQNGEKARQYFEYVLGKDPKAASPELYYHYARTLHGQSEFQKAADAYKQYLRAADDRHPLRRAAYDHIRRCLSGIALKPNPAIALVENMGGLVNSKGDEFAPLPSRNRPGRMYFSAIRAGNIGGRRNDDGYEDETSGRWCSDIFFAEKRTSGWEEGGSMGSLLNSPRHEIALEFGDKGNILYYYRGFTLYGGDIYADTAEVKDEYALEPALFNSPVDGPAGDNALCFFNDSTLLFASRRDGGQGGYDLYMTRLRFDGWSEPENLGPAVNSPYDETTPFLARDGRTLYFSSNRPESMGGHDVFQARFNDQTKTWSPPRNYGPPLNSPGNDAWFRISADGLTASFASDRFGGFGDRDLYLAYFLEAQTEQLAQSNPPVFADLITPVLAGESASGGALRMILPALYYESDDDLLNPENAAAISEIARLARAVPDAQVLVSVHTKQTGPAKFDLYYGIKRAERIGEALVGQGVPPHRIRLLSAAAAFPAAKLVIGAEPYPAGEMLNSRITFDLAAIDRSEPLQTEQKQRPIPEAAVNPAAGRFRELNKGLNFRVEFANTRQILASDLLAMYSEVFIETTPGEGVFHYTAGAARSFEEAAALRNDLKSKGFAEAAVVAYIDGIRLSKAQAIAQLKKYPSLAPYIRQ